MLKRNISGIPLMIIMLSSVAFGGVSIFPANQELSSPERWHNIDNVYIDDGLYAIDTCSSNKLDTFTVGLADPIDTLYKKISKVTIYAKARTHYPRAMFWLWPVYENMGYRSGNLKIGTTETLYSFDITPQDTALADSSWNWNDIADLGIRFQARTTKVIYFVNYMFAAVTYVDTINEMQSHHFQIDPIPTPQTVGIPFTLNVSVLDSLGGILTSYNGSALINDLTGTVSPIMMNFTNGLGSVAVSINDTLTGDNIIIDDGVASDTSNAFDVVLGAVHHFAIDTISSPQVMAQQFSISISARNFFDDTVVTFSDKAGLFDKTGTITPDSVGPFISGLWNGNVSVASAISSDTVLCSYYNGNTITGTSNGFEVYNPSGIEGDKPSIQIDQKFNFSISPNPARNDAKFIMSIPKAGMAELIVYNILGQAVNRKELGNLSAGQAVVDMNFASFYPQGLYFVKATLEGHKPVIKKLVITK